MNELTPLLATLAAIATILAVVLPLVPRIRRWWRERQSFRKAIIQLASRLDIALAMSNQASATASAGGDWISASRSMVKQCGHSASELLGRGWYNAIDYEDAPRVRERWEQCVADKREFDSGFSWRRHDGTLVPVRMVAWFVASINGFVISSRKVTAKELPP